MENAYDRQIEIRLKTFPDLGFFWEVDKLDMECITTITFFVLVNEIPKNLLCEENFSYFPYAFIIYAEYLGGYIYFMATILKFRIGAH